MGEKTGVMQIRVKPAFQEAIKWAAAQDDRSVSSKVVLIVEDWLRKHPSPKTGYLTEGETDGKAA